MTSSLFRLMNVDATIPADIYVAARTLFDRMMFTDAIELLIEAISCSHSRSSETDSKSGYDGWLLLAQCHFWNGEADKAKEIHAAVERQQSRVPDHPDKRLLDCNILIYEGAFEAAYRILSDWVQECLDLGDIRLSEPMLHRGYASLRLGNLEEALEDFESAYALARLQNSYRLKTELSNYLGMSFVCRGQYIRAIEWYSRSREIGTELGSLTRIGRPALNIGICHYRLGDYRNAFEHLNQALETLEQADDKLNICRVYIALANVHRLVREFDRARELLATAYTMTQELGCDREQCLALEFLGDVCRDDGKYEEALRYYRRAMSLAKTLAPEGDLVCELMRREGETLILDGQPGVALEILAKNLILARKTGDRPEEGVILRCLAVGFLQVSDLDRALDYATKAYTVLEEIDARHEHAIARLVAGEILLRLSSVGDQQQPRDLLDKAWEQSIIAQGIILKLDIEYWTDAVKRLQAQITRRRVEEQRFHASTVLLKDGAERPVREQDPEQPQVVIAESRAMKEVLQATEAFAPYNEPVLITGETGTGKELIAKLLHQHSERSKRRLLTVNVAAVPHSMFEREFFGHARGAFSGADADGEGLAAAADGGTLFLDEIGELPVEIQAKLLRLLQDGRYLRLGDPREKRADLRIIAATNRDLLQAVQEGQFREDLYYRLAGLEIHLPPVRERPEDIGPLCEHYLSCCEQRSVTLDQYFNPLSRRLLERYHWPGNVREIVQTAKRAYFCKVRHGRVEITLGSGDHAIILTGPEPMAAVAVAGGQDREPMTRAHLLLALEECEGNRTEAARMLGISRSALYRRLEKLGLD